MLSQATYLISALRPLKDTEKQIGVWTNQHVEGAVQRLIQRIACEASFDVDLLQLTPGCNYRQLQQASVLVHLAAVVVCMTQGDLFHLLAAQMHCATNRHCGSESQITTFLSRKLARL